jgi:predicted NUDIX family NTP pyrophosphohydrolase
MGQTSAGLLMYRKSADGLQVLLIHPGGPFWRNKDEGSWSIPKGGVNDGEELIDAARREFEEETGCKPIGQWLALSPVRLKSRKTIHAWAFEGTLDPATVKSNTFMLEWPPRSGKVSEYPEVDRADFFDLPTALKKIHPAQAAFVHELTALLLNK